MQRLKHEDRLYIMPFFLVFCLLYLISFCLISVSVVAQDEESFIPSSEFRQGYDPDSASYSAVAKAVYWERSASMALSSGDQGGALEAYKEALSLANEAIRLDPRSSYLRAKLAELSINTEDYDAAISAADSAVELDPSNADAYYFSGYLKLRKSQDKVGALADFKKAAELEPNHLKANLYLGTLALESGNYRLASNAYAKMVKLRPYDPELRYRLAFSYSSSGEGIKAIDEYKAAIVLEDNVKSHYGLADLYARLGKNREAIDENLIVLTRAPNNPDVMLRLAQLYIAIGDYDKSIAIGDSVLRRNGNKKEIGAEALYLLGTAYKEKGEKKLSDENLQKSIDIYKNLLAEDAEKNIGFNYDIAKVYDAKGERDLARKHLERFVYLKPDSSDVPNAYNYLGYIMVEQNKDLDKAVVYIEKAIAVDPDNGAFRDSLGWAYFRLGKIDEAMAELEKAVVLTPDDSDVREHLGEVYVTKGGEYIQKAIVEWEKAIELKPNKAILRQKLDGIYAKRNSGLK